MLEQRTEDTGRVELLAQRLEDAWTSGRTIAPLSESEGLESPEEAYAIQSRALELRALAGDRVIGRKVGLTSKAMQEQMGVDEPDYGALLESRFYPARDGRAEMPHGTFIQPRLEGEFAYLVGAPLAGGAVTPSDVLAATEAIAVSVEVIDSRITDWRIRLADTIADHASYGALTLGPWSRSLVGTDLRTLGMLVHRGGERVVEAVGAAVLGDPTRAVAWLANKLYSFGLELAPGDVVLSGSLGRSIPVAAGDVFTVEVHGQRPLTVAFDTEG